MAQIVGIRTTPQVITEERLVRVVDDEIAMLEPETAPLITLLNKLKKRSPTESYKFEWPEGDYVARWAQNSATAVANNTNSTTVTVTDGTLFAVGDMFVVPKAVSSSVAPEVCRVTNVATNTLTVTRDWGGAGVDTIPANAALRLIGDSQPEGAALSTAKTKAPAMAWNFTQIFKTPIKIAKSLLAQRLYGVPNGERAWQHKVKLVEHKIKLNGALLFGRREAGLTAGPAGERLSTTAGIRATIGTNVADAGGILTKKFFESFARTAFRYGSPRILLASPIVISAINAWATKFLMVKPGERLYGVDIEEVHTGHGVWLLVKDLNLEDGISGQSGFAGLTFSLNLDEIGYRYLSANGVNRDTKLTENVDQTGGDYVFDEILTEAGFQIKQEKHHAMLYNVTDYSE